jgi:hypothetical protein
MLKKKTRKKWFLSEFLILFVAQQCKSGYTFFSQNRDLAPLGSLTFAKLRCCHARMILIVYYFAEGTVKYYFDV